MANDNKKQQYGERFRDLCYEKLNSRVYHVIGLCTVSRKKGATDFFAATFTNIDGVS